MWFRKKMYLCCMKNQIYFKRDGERYINFFTIERETKCYYFLRSLTVVRERINVAIDVVTPGEPTQQVIKHCKKYTLNDYTGQTIYTDSGYQCGTDEDDRLWREFLKRLKREDNLQSLLVD